MKYLLLALVILVIFWLWRRDSQAANGGAAAPGAPAPSSPKAVTEIVACSVCQVHLPRSEALIGRAGAFYCSQAHRHEAGG